MIVCERDWCRHAGKDLYSFSAAGSIDKFFLANYDLCRFYTMYIIMPCSGVSEQRSLLHFDSVLIQLQ